MPTNVLPRPSKSLKSTFFDEKPTHPCWFDLFSKELGARIHFSYHPLGDIEDLDRLVNDAFRIANKINQRSNYMDEYQVRSEAGASPSTNPSTFSL